MIRIRFPWQRRADVERAHRIHAEKRLDDVRRDWAPVGRQTAAIRKEAQRNDWTDTIVSIFESTPHAGGSNRG
jgi:hypothetical protein